MKNNAVPEDFADVDEDTNPWNDVRAVALAMAVMHHGMSNWAERSIPPRADTVIATATAFERHLKGLPPDPDIIQRTSHRTST